MKRKVGELNNIPIVEGDPNLLKSNEILHKGGGKLSKRDNTGEIKDLGSSDSGSGSGEGVKEYYYKILNDEVVEMIKILVYGEIIIKISTGENINGSLTSLYEGSTYKSLLAVKIYDIKLYVFNASDGVFNKNLGPYEGDIWNRIATYMSIGGEIVTSEQVKEYLSNSIQEITKEEYESLITQ